MTEIEPKTLSEDESRWLSTIRVCESCGTSYYIADQRRLSRHGFGCELCDRDLAAQRDDTAAYEKLNSIG